MFNLRKTCYFYPPFCRKFHIISDHTHLFESMSHKTMLIYIITIFISRKKLLHYHLISLDENFLIFAKCKRIVVRKSAFRKLSHLKNVLSIDTFTESVKIISPIEFFATEIKFYDFIYLRTFNFVYNFKLFVLLTDFVREIKNRHTNPCMNLAKFKSLSHIDTFLYIFIHKLLINQR